jgi:hypothetical protein
MEHLDAEVARGLATGSATPELRARWEPHLKVCDRCRALVARERNWAGLARLDQEPPDLGGGAERLLARMNLPSGGGRGFRRRLLALALAGLGGAAGGLAYRLTTAPRAPAVGPERAHPPRELLARLELLQVLQRDPWLLEDYETVRWMDGLLSERPGGPP